MIKINLAKRRKNQGAKSAGLFGISGLKAGNLDVNSLRDVDWKRSPLAKLLVSVIVIYGLETQLASMKQERLVEEDAKIAAVQAELDEITQKLAKVRGFEPLKKQLEDDEKNIQTKLNIIASLTDNKDVPSKLLRQISQIIPQEVWLNRLAITEGKFQIAGGSSSYNLVSDFMKGLADSSLFSGVNLSQVGESANESVRYQAFDISAQAKGFE